MHPYRTHNCGELRSEHAGQEVRLGGWVYRKRDHGSLLFVDLRDHYGVTQVVINPEREFFEAFQRIRPESVVIVTGLVALRSEDTINPNLDTGRVEVVAGAVTIEGQAEALPLQVAAEEDGPEETRLRYRFLDLRRPRLHRNIMLRSKVIASIRHRMHGHGFSEFQTPILTASSPEGARDYLVPSRLYPGKFYALPQAPQMFKQLLMVSGFDRYFQIAPCFRDEDSRADRSPGEFYQLDLEMSFVTQDDVFQVVEEVFSGVFKEFSDSNVDAAPFKRFPYAESMDRFGTDKPDLRNPLEMVDVSEIFKTARLNAFRSVVEKGGVVKAIAVQGIADKPRNFFDKLDEFAKGLGAPGLAYLIWAEGAVKGPIAKFMDAKDLDEISRLCKIGTGDVVFFVCNTRTEANRLGNEVRTKLGRDLDLLEKNAFRFCWIVDFPMYERDPETGKIQFSHNPFSMPQGGLDVLTSKSPLDVLAFQYDLVCNGVELSSGAIRNHSPEIMYKAFEIAGYSKEEVEKQFPGLLNAFRFGAPPHGGIAPGIDRIVMLLANESNIREVISFPMNQRAQDLMMNAPEEVTEKQLRELHIKVNLPKPKEEKTPSPGNSTP